MSKNKKVIKSISSVFLWFISIVAALLAVCSLTLITSEPVVAIIMLLIFAAIAFFSCPAIKKSKNKKKISPKPTEKKVERNEYAAKKCFLGSAELQKVKDGAPEAYRYLVPFTPKNEQSIMSAKLQDWKLTAIDKNGVIYLYSGDESLGELLHPKAQMLRDWIRNSEPYEIVVRSRESETEFNLLIVFYRDKANYYKNRQQEVVTLVSFKSKAKQEIIYMLEQGNEVCLEDDFDSQENNTVTVTYEGEQIGKLPTKTAKQFLENGAVYAAVEEIQEEINENGDSIYIPSIRIYW